MPTSITNRGGTSDEFGLPSKTGGRACCQPMHLRPPHAVLIALIGLAALPLACHRESPPDFTAELARLKTEAVGLRQKLGTAEQTVETQKDALELARATAAATKTEAAESGQLARQKDAQLRAAQAELAELKKSEALAFAEIGGLQKKGLTALALSRYAQFLKDHPDSPLAPHAANAVTQLTATAAREARAHASVVDPKRKEREVLQYFADGLATVEEIAPLLKNRTPAEVVKLLGPPHRTYRDGTEFGYEDKVSDSATGTKNTLVISFEEGRVSGLRTGYTGRITKP